MDTIITIVENPIKIIKLTVSEQSNIQNSDVFDLLADYIERIKFLIKDRILVRIEEGKKQYWFFMSGEWNKCSSKEAMDVVDYVYTNYLETKNIDEKISNEMLEKWKKNKLLICDKIFNDISANFPETSNSTASDSTKNYTKRKKYDRKSLLNIDDKIKRFLEESVIITEDINNILFNKELYEKYKLWSEKINEKPCQINIFGRSLKELGIISKWSNKGRILLYLKMKD